MKPGESVPYYPNSQDRPICIPRQFAFCSLIAHPPTTLRFAQKCRVLLHLGNSVSFFVDNADYVPYDFDYRHCS